MRETIEQKLREESRYKDKATLEMMDLCMGAADAIEQLRTENAALRKQLDSVKKQAKLWKERFNLANKAHKIAIDELFQAAAERDAAIEDISHICATCGEFKGGTCPVLGYKGYPTQSCGYWNWRGAKMKEAR